MTAVTVLDGPDAVRAALGTHLGTSPWIEITQERIDQFAAATGDHQWIHVDADRALAGPFGAPIAHGYLTLALSNFFLPQIVDVRGFSMGVNYGVDKVRFPAPVRVGSTVRASAELADVTDVTGGATDVLQTTMTVTIEIDGSTKPACVIEAISRWFV
jgi:acyl dehydratase